ncbi:MAG: DUF4062 domain-containing protein [Aquabacterium sp.]|uniref:DUF4062 domain-containing protein n=1 Tax=Aquabacterium sp. TaxID=1872578 RepID=UPI001DDDDA4E|nr:DUF4062 domain-containing protein [Aquabacterium sp.]MBT9609258.1 DUF4062 domain-containing protein [Aquabacterium sp.]
MEKRYQVFVSSTFRDLEHERQEVMHALLELDCMPSGMELFPAANESQWNLIKKVIDDCDYYILILAGRYGSIGPDGISYTEMEYRYALESGKPTIAFLHRDPGKVIADKSESTDEGKAKLKAFRESVEKKLCKHWDSPQELGSVVSRSLIQLIKSTPAVGWVRANELADREATMELLQLRRKVEELQTEIARSRTSAPKGAEGLAQGDEEHSVRYSFNATPPGEYRSTTWSATFNPTWNELFASIAPLMIQEATEPGLKSALDSLAGNMTIERLQADKKLARHSLASFRIGQDDFQTIKVQLRALGLIARSEKTRSVKDSGTYWTLTPYGDEVMTQLRAIRKNHDASSDVEELVEGEE